MELYKKIQQTKDLPNPFIPASSDFFKEQFYWDSYFIITGLITEGEKGYSVAKGIAENFAHLIKKIGYVPNSHKSYNTRSQPPFFSSIILIIYNHYRDKKWLKKMYRSLKKEYKYWNKKNHRTKNLPLLKYSGSNDKKDDEISLNYNATQESGWDMTLRFEEKCSEIAALDLNCLIHKMLKDLEFIAKEIEKPKQSEYWKNKSLKLKNKINELMFNKKENLYFDYNTKEKKQLKTKTLATFFPLFTKIATKKQAEKIVKNLKLFEHDYGLATTTKDLIKADIQWGYPNGWAPLQYIAIYGLLNYGYKKEAIHIAKKYTNKIEKIKKWPEKISVVKHRKAIDDPRYLHQDETYWTVGVYKNLIHLIKNTKS